MTTPQEDRASRRPQHLRIADLPRESLLGGTWQRTAVRGDGSLVTFNWMDPAMPPQPLHDHPLDQVSLVTEGSMRFEVGGESFLVEAGDVVLIPGGVPHTGVAVGDGVALNIDVYAPVRQDYLHLTAHQGEPGEPAAPPAAGGPGDDDPERAVTRLLHEWAEAFDAGRSRDAADLLSEDAVIDGLLREPVGREGFLDWAEKRDAASDGRCTQHHVTNVRWKLTGPGEVRSSAYVVVHAVDRSDPSPRVVFVGRYDDDVRLTEQGARFVRREIRPLRAD